MRIVTAAAVVTALLAGPAAAEEKTAIFAGGCFWCVESDFDKVEGVLATVSGYAGGTTTDPTYKQVTYGSTGHYEVVQITYDSTVVQYHQLVLYFFRHVDPTDDGGQFCDRGHSYRTAIFATDEQRAIAEEAKAEVEELLTPEVVTPILDAATFYRAEEFHQDYYQRNPLRYKYYRFACGRDARVAEVWAEAEPRS